MKEIPFQKIEMDMCTFSLLFASGLTGMISEDLLDQLVATLFELIDDSVVQGILVLLEPAGDIVGHLKKSDRHETRVGIKTYVGGRRRRRKKRTVPA